MEPKIYVFDLDGTLCEQVKDHENPKPYLERIAKVNKLYDEGNTIIIDTARGSRTGINWRPVTDMQLRTWGVKFHELRVGTKTYGDYYIDDKAQNDKDFFQ